MEQLEKWYTLMDYAVEFKVSMSTLRRNIKLGTIKHKLEAGKYYVCGEILKKNKSYTDNTDLKKQLDDVSAALVNLQDIVNNLKNKI